MSPFTSGAPGADGSPTQGPGPLRARPPQGTGPGDPRDARIRARTLEGLPRRRPLRFRWGPATRPAALALTKWFQMECPGVQTVCLDTPWPIRRPWCGASTPGATWKWSAGTLQLWGYFYEAMEHPESQDGLLSTLNELAERLSLAKPQPRPGEFRARHHPLHPFLRQHAVRHAGFPANPGLLREHRFP
ncbi:MAG: hypothetical protein M0C28_00085 [Candidatus Moduliflexus flocculans]|nr:hypothetical protein [Candidatus Moduliflexus flocculans]